MDFTSLFNAAKKFEKQAQTVTVTAQPGDIQTALEQANLWNMQKAVAPMLNQAGVPEDATVNISVLADTGPKVGYNVLLQPNNPKISNTLAALLKQKFAPAMTDALKKSNVSINSLMVVNWLKF